jgi:hypothetical protein
MAVTSIFMHGAAVGLEQVARMDRKTLGVSTPPNGSK